MPSRLTARCLALGALAAAAALPSPAPAQPTWPERPVRFVVPLPPGGPSDIVLRGALEKMQATLKQPLVPENKPGAAGNLGAAEVARAAPDGHTGLWTTDTLVTVNPHVYQRLAYNIEDLQPVMRASAFSQTLVCNPALDIRTVRDLVARAKAKPLGYASGGAGPPGHLASELFSATAGITMSHNPYEGPAPAMQDVMGYPGYDATFSLVLSAPRGTPEPIVRAMHAAMSAALTSPDVVERLRQSDQEVLATSPAQTVARLAADSKTWSAVAKRIQLTQD